MFSLAPFVEVTDKEAESALVAHVAVASAAGVSPKRLRSVVAELWPVEPSVGDSQRDRLDVLLREPDRWQALMVEVLQGEEPPPRLDLVGLEFTTFSPILDTQALFDSRSRRRMDAVLDLMDADFCCYDVQNLFAEGVAELETGAANQLGRREILGYAKTAAQYLTYIHPVVGIAAGFGLKLFNEDSIAEPGERNDADVDRFARLLIACRHVLSDTDRATTVKRAQEELGSRVHQGAREISADAERVRQAPSPVRVEALRERERQQRILIGVMDGLAQIESAEATETNVPSLIGLRLSDAGQTLTALGVGHTYVDALKPNGNPRNIFNPGNWKVIHQVVTHDPSGTRALLHAIKYGETQPPFPPS